MALSLEGAARRLEDSDPDAAAALRRGASQTRGSVQSLRNLLVEIYPPSLQRAGLRTALEDLLAPVAARGIETGLEFDDGVDLATEEEALCFRVTQESLRNALKHAGGARVDVSLSSCCRRHEADGARRWPRIRTSQQRCLPGPNGDPDGRATSEPT